MSKPTGLPQAALQEVDDAKINLTAAIRDLERALDGIDNPGIKLLVALATSKSRQAIIHLQRAASEARPMRMDRDD